MSKKDYSLQNDIDLKEGEESSLDDLDINPSVNHPIDENSESGSPVKVEEDGVMVSKSKLAMVSSLLDSIKASQEKITQLLAEAIDSEQISRISIGQIATSEHLGELNKSDEGRIIEGVFDGENMIGPDGKQYSVPANYASKSKLVEGDILKLTITSKGTFVYKQIGPIERSRVIGGLQQDENGVFTVISEDKEWKVLTASVTYYKGKDGDEIVILVPKLGESKWAAVENIVRKAV